MASGCHRAVPQQCDRYGTSGGEAWRFESKAFLPHDDGLTLIVVQDGVQRPIRLQWTPEAQGQIIQDFGQYVAAPPAVGAAPAPQAHKISYPRIILSVIGVVGLIALYLCMGGESLSSGGLVHYIGKWYEVHQQRTTWLNRQMVPCLPKL
jgi:hypothetical protein